MKLKHRMVEKETVETKQSLLVLPVAHSATNGDNGVSNSNLLSMKSFYKCYELIHLYFKKPVLLVSIDSSNHRTLSRCFAKKYFGILMDLWAWINFVHQQGKRF